MEKLRFSKDYSKSSAWKSQQLFFPNGILTDTYDELYYSASADIPA